MLVKCKFCGEKHPMGGSCKVLGQGSRSRPSESAPKVSQDRSLTAPPKAAAKRCAASMRAKVEAETPATVQATVRTINVTAGETVPKFDRVAYQREYMRKRRAKAKETRTTALANEVRAIAEEGLK